MRKLQNKMYKIGTVKENEIDSYLEKYDEVVLGALENKITELKAEHEELKATANKITLDMDMNVYLANQERVKELPNIIIETEKEKIAITQNRENYKNDVCRTVAKEIGTEYMEEFNGNMEVLKEELDKAVTEMIEVYKKMQELESDYVSNVYTIVTAPKVYMTLEKNTSVNRVLGKHNITSLNLFNAKNPE